MNRLLTALSHYNENCYQIMHDTNVFPIELDLPQTTFQYSGAALPQAYHDDDEEEEEDIEPLVLAEEALPESKSDDELLLPGFSEEENVTKELAGLNLLED
ncbi:PRKCA-binding protein [Trichonephila inaurata madagascariensis]|uniref:PRKCA-binding protein n=1 Tax=Trichonephila inaurata madagascariensis TaxID=2747483 RepID=A0A8X7BWP7_9ARAC|nr:PRKCA-binding protein [Trichonephila inaurata madagascariensis]